MGQFHTWSRLRNCFGMRGGNVAWPEEQDRRSFCAGLMVECLACNEGADVNAWADTNTNTIDVIEYMF